MPSVQFFYEDTAFSLLSPDSINTWISNCIQQEGFTLQALNFIFCSDEYLHKINVEYLDHDYYTDIITFDNSEEGDQIEGDIFISVERIQDNSEEHTVSFMEELHRVIIHGVLHLTGYNDKSDSEKKEMREKENAYLSLLQF
ncbi:MAG: rRNA maturation RNase YbeY [Cyclobacteriaceae bacterium]